MATIVERLRGSIASNTDSETQATEKMGRFVRSACEAAAAIVLDDGIITLTEYDGLTQTVNAMRKMIKDDPAQVSLWSLQALHKTTSVDTALRELRKNAVYAPSEVRKAVGKALQPVIIAQGAQTAEIAGKVQQALDVESGGIVETLNELTRGAISLPGSLLQGAVNRMRVQISGDERLNGVENFARLFLQHDLLNALQRYRSSRSEADLDILRHELERARSSVHEHLSDLERRHQCFLATRSAAETLERVVGQLKNQAARRLQSVRLRAKRQQTWFEEDIERFLNDSSNEVILRLHRHTALKENWTEKQFWDDFLKSKAGLILQAKHEALRHRYDEMMQNWQEELTSFNEELVFAREGVLEAIQEKTFGELISPASIRTRVLGGVDCGAAIMAGAITSGSALVGIGSAVAIGTGHVALLANAAAVAGGLLSNPFGWGALGLIGAAFAYKSLSDPVKRRVRELDGKHDEIKKGLREILGDAPEKHQQALDKILASFEQLAQTQIAPLEKEHQTLQELAELEEKLVERVLTNTRTQIEAMTLA